MCNKVILRLFDSDTEEDDFSGFSVQEEDKDRDSVTFVVGICFNQPCYCCVTAVLLSCCYCVTAV